MLCSVLAWQGEEKRKIKESYSKDFNAILDASKYQVEEEDEEQEEQQQPTDEQQDDDSDAANFRPLKRAAVERPASSGPPLPLPPNKESSEPKAAPVPAPPPKPKKPAKIYVASRTHAQIAQLVKELRSSPYRPSMVVLGSREQYCIHPQVSQSAHGSKNVACKKLLKEMHGCSYKNNKSRLYLNPALQVGGQLEVWDVEDLTALGRETRACPYFAARAMAAPAEIVFCPYNYLLEPGIRSALDIKIADSVIIFDEAHNIESICTDTASLDFDLTVFEGAVEDLRKNTVVVDEPTEEMIKAMEQLRDWLVEMANGDLNRCPHQRDTAVYEGVEITALLDNVGINAETLKRFVKTFGELTGPARDEKKPGGAAAGTEERGEEPGLVTDHRVPKGNDNTQSNLQSATEGIIGGLFNVLEFMLNDNMKYMLDYKMVVCKQEERRGAQKKLVTKVGFWCMNPAAAFAELRRQARCVILASGTLSPMDSFSTELGVDFPIRIETSHVIQPELQLWAGVIPRHRPADPTFHWTFKNSESVSLLDALGHSIIDVCHVIPKGVLVFFSSYAMLRRVEKRWRETDIWERLNSCKRVVVEPQTGDSGSMERVMGWYYLANGNSRDKPSAGQSRKFSDLYDAKTGKKKKPARRSNNYEGEDAPIIRKEQTGGLFLAVCRGKASEGIDFSDDNARAVILVGIPFPNSQDLRLIYKKAYNDAKRKTLPAMLNGSAWYSLQAFRALNQAVGRCIRHRHDYGALLFFDERYNEQKTQQSVSKWIRPQIKQYQSCNAALDSLKAFFETNGAAAQQQVAPVPLIVLDETHLPPIPLAAAAAVAPDPVPLPAPEPPSNNSKKQEWQAILAGGSHSQPNTQQESSPAASPSDAPVRVCCANCYRPVASAPRSDCLARRVQQVFLRDMQQHLTSSADPVAEAEVIQVPSAQRAASVSLGPTQFVEQDWLVYAVLQCQCQAFVGVEIKCVDQPNVNLLGNSWFLKAVIHANL